MKKFTILLILVTFCFVSFAQEKYATQVFIKTKERTSKSTIFSEDFSSWSPADWTIQSGPESEASGDELWHDGGGMAQILYVDGSMCDEWLISRK